MINSLDIAALAGSLVSSARSNGIEYEMHSDFQQTNAICDAMGKTYNTRLIDPFFHDFTKSNCFWLLAKQVDVPIACIGLRMDNFSKGEFINFLDRQYARAYFSTGAGVIDTNLCPPPFHQIEGPTVYLGDLFVKPEHRGRNHAFRLGEMILLAQTMAYTEWNFAWLYAFIREDHADAGYTSLYGAAFQYPSAIRWKEAPTLRANSDWFIGMRGCDFRFIVAVERQKTRR